MPINPDILDFSALRGGGDIVAPQRCYPMQIVMDWGIVIAAGGLVVADAGAGTLITNVETQIVHATRQIFECPEGTSLALMLASASGSNVAQAPIPNVFGRSRAGKPWQRLRNRANADSGVNCTIAVTNNDVRDGTLRYSSPDLDKNIWDMNGCRQFIVGLEQVLDNGGQEASAVLLAKPF